MFFKKFFLNLNGFKCCLSLYCFVPGGQDTVLVAFLQNSSPNYSALIWHFNFLYEYVLLSSFLKLIMPSFCFFHLCLLISSSSKRGHGVRWAFAQVEFAISQVNSSRGSPPFFPSRSLPLHGVFEVPDTHRLPFYGTLQNQIYGNDKSCVEQ